MEEMEESNFNKIRESLPENYRMIEVPFDADSIQYYIQLLRQYHDEKLDSDADFIQLIDAAQNAADLEKLLIQISELATPQAYRAFEHLLKKEQDLVPENFIKICQAKCQILLENELLDEPIAFISSGLGTKDGKLRVNVFILTEIDESLTEAKFKYACGEIQSILNHNEIEVESQTRFQDCIINTCLSPLDKDLKTVVNQIIETIDFLSDNILISNFHKIDNPQVIAWMKREVEFLSGNPPFN